MTPNETPRPANPTPERKDQHTLAALLGIKAIYPHVRHIGLYYLIGCKFHEGARSLRQIANTLQAMRVGGEGGDLAGRVAEAVPTSLRAIHQAIVVLEKLVGQKLVNRTGEGLSYDGFTPDGEWLWGLTADFAREFWG